MCIIAFSIYLMYMHAYWLYYWDTSRVLCCDSLRSDPSFHYSNYTLTLHCKFLTSGDIKYDLQSRLQQANEDRNPQQCIRYFCKVFLLLQPSVEGYIVSPKEPNTWLKPGFRNISLCVWQAIEFAEAPVERDYITISAPPLSCNKPPYRSQTSSKGLNDNNVWVHRL